MPASTELRAERRVDLMVKSATTSDGSLLASYWALISAGVSLEVSGMKLRSGCASGWVAVSFTPFFFAPRMRPLRNAALSHTEILIGSLHLVGHQVAHATSSVGCGAIGVNLDHLVQPNDGDFPISIGERFPGTIVVGT